MESFIYLFPNTEISQHCRCIKQDCRNTDDIEIKDVIDYTFKFMN